MFQERLPTLSGVAKGGRSAPGGTMGYAVGYKTAKAVLK